jgi:hypothetical protein
MTPPTSVEEWKNHKDIYCCDGGASYLKVVYHAGNDEAGLLTFDPAIAAEFSTCDLVYQESKRGNGNGNGKSRDNGNTDDHSLRFVPCDDLCVIEPLTRVPCSDTMSAMEVTNGTEVCVAMVNVATDEVLLDQKMGTNVYFYLIPDGAGEVGALQGVVHASCSKPIVPPYAASFNDPCHFDEENALLNLEYYSGSIPYLAFVDGISTKYFQSVKNTMDDAQDQGSYMNDFDITFGNCGCTCENFVPPNPLPTYTPTLGVTAIGEEDPGFVPPTPVYFAPSDDPTSSPSGEIIETSSVTPNPEVTQFPATEPASSPVEDDGNGALGPGSSIPSDNSKNCATTCATYLQGGSESNGNAGENVDDDGRRLRQIEYHYARIEALGKILALMD